MPELPQSVVQLRAKRLGRAPRSVRYKGCCAGAATQQCVCRANVAAYTLRDAGQREGGEGGGKEGEGEGGGGRKGEEEKKEEEEGEERWAQHAH